MRILIIMGLLIGMAQAQEIVRVDNWPLGVPCTSLKHRSDGTWALADIVIGPDGTRHYPSPDPQSVDNKQIAKVLSRRCKTEYGSYQDKDSPVTLKPLQPR